VVYSNFEQVASLDTSSQQHLLLNGEPVERVWAAWALGLQLGKGADPDLIASLGHSPHPGTRRHLVVILARHGEQAILRILALDDPDDYVRATACEYVIRTNSPADQTVQQFIRERLLADPSPAVRLAILRTSPPGYPALLFDDLALLSTDPDPDVRLSAAGRLLAGFPADSLLPGVIAERISLEANARQRRHLLKLAFETGCAVRLLSTDLPPDRTLEILKLFLDAGMSFPWKDLERWSRAHDPRCDVLLVQLLRADSVPAALPWLLECVIHAATGPLPAHRADAQAVYASRTCAANAVGLLFAALPQIGSREWIGLDDALRQAAIESLQNSIARLELERDETEWESMFYEYAEIIRKRRELLLALKSFAA
jgi:hypothetical protein